MAFTLKSIQAARDKRRNTKGPLLRQQQNIPAVPAGPTNSNPTKAGAKRSTKVPNNSSNTLKGPRKVTTGKNNTKQVVLSKGTARGANSKRSSRINYSMLRKAGK